jgi:hypothetical protein
MITFDRRAFPPMAKPDRKILYELAIPFGLTGDSKGSGKNRYPILVKTKSTAPYNEQKFLRMERHVLRKNGRLHEDSYSSGGYGTASLKHGDIVGASAPTITTSSKSSQKGPPGDTPLTAFSRIDIGRQMLEKMGWKEGDALGHGTNKGILEPIAQVYRSGKAGLR